MATPEQTESQAITRIGGHKFHSQVVRDLLVEQADGVKAAPPAYLVDGVFKTLMDSVTDELTKQQQHYLRTFVQHQFNQLVADKIFCEKGRNRYQLRNQIVEAQQEKLQLSLPLESQLFAGDDYETEKSFAEGIASSSVSITYERDPKARLACLSIHGLACVVCSFNFEAEFGQIGRSYIHVHHLEPLYQGERQTNPEKDLRPVCPNCHSMLHKRNPPFSIEELKEIRHNVKQ